MCDINIEVIELCEAILSFEKYVKIIIIIFRSITLNNHYLLFLKLLIY
jgi:hypothetical protein